MISRRLFFNSSTQLQRSICWEVWTLYLKKMECTMPILQSFFNNSMLVDCLLLYFVSPVILLRNLDPGEGLCNGTRIVVLNVKRKVLQCRIISKDRRFRGKVVLILRIRLSPNAETLPVPLKRLQFPVRLAFAMTINKSQGQSVEHVGINLQTSVFFHGQLYVAFSRCTSPQYFFQSRAKRVEGHLM